MLNCTVSLFEKATVLSGFAGNWVKTCLPKQFQNAKTSETVTRDNDQ